MPLVERHGCRIVHRGFEYYRMTTGGTQPLLGGVQQLRSDPRSPSVAQDIDGDNVTVAAAPRPRPR